MLKLLSIELFMNKNEGCTDVFHYELKQKNLLEIYD
jgi:hypothetical protein